MMPRARPTPLFLVQPTLETLLEDHLIQELLCKDLEAVADHLPELLPLHEIRRLCERITRITSTHFARAEEIIERVTPRRGYAPHQLEMVRYMHQLDELHAQDLISELWAYVAHRKGCSAGQLAYMLRCYFDGCRRAMALKESLIANLNYVAARSD